MTFIPMSLQNIQTMAQNDTQQMRTFIDWVTDRYQAYAQNCTTENMTTAGISTNDQNAILAFIGDLNRLKLLMSGTLPSDATDVRYDCSAILGIY